MQNDITVHMIVRNEDQFVWYALQSVLPYAQVLLVYDTGSEDRTIDIIKSISSPKILFEEKKAVDAKRLSELRQEQILRTKTRWIWIVDGDEIYPQRTAQKVLAAVKDYQKDGIIIHRYDLLGDIYHYQDESVGIYNQFGQKGHYVLRLINKNNFHKLQVKGTYPNEYFACEDGISVKERGKNNFIFISDHLFHAMYLKRSSLGGNIINMINRRKRKIELGKSLDNNTIPEIFFRKNLKDVPNVTYRISWLYLLLAILITPVKKIKRKLIPDFYEKEDSFSQYL